MEKPHLRTVELTPEHVQGEFNRLVGELAIHNEGPDFAQWESELATLSAQTNPTSNPDITASAKANTPDAMTSEGAVAEAEEIAAAAVPEPSLPAWPEGNPDGTSTQETYNGRLNWRLGNAGRYLDQARGSITNEADAAKWLQLKTVIYRAKKIDNPLGRVPGGAGDKVDTVIDTETTVYGFLHDRLGVV